MIAVTVRVNNHCPAFLKLVAIYSWWPALLGVKQEGLAIVNFLNKLIVSCKEAVRIPIFWGVIFKLDSYFLF
jgi:hypothetical protein